MLVVAFCCPSVATAQVSQFDLNCTGNSDVYRDGKIVQEPFVQTIRVDFTKGEYCTDDCSEILKIQEVNSIKITLVDESRKPSAISIYRNIRTIDRTNGGYKIEFMDSNSLQSLKADAVCNRAPFTPFPTTKF